MQAKLKIGQPGDKYEKEADRVAEEIMGRPEPGPLLARSNCKPCEEELRRQPVEEEEEEEFVQAKEATGQLTQASPDLAGQIKGLSGKGQPLPESERVFFEPRLGYDLSRVRFHADEQAEELTRSVNARAFTLGQHIFFGAGEYALGVEEGRRLLAHELTHVIQQSTNPDLVPNTIQRDRRNISGPYQGISTYERVDQRPRIEGTGTIHYGIVIYIPRRIGETEVNVDTALSCIYGALLLELVTQQCDRARDLMERNSNLRDSIARLLRIQRDREEIAIYLDYEREPERSYRVSSLRVAGLLIDFPHPTEEEIWGPVTELQPAVTIGCFSNTMSGLYDASRRFMRNYCQRTGNPVPNNFNDAFGHCWISCALSRCVGTAVAATLGTGREVYRELDQDPHDSLHQDLANQSHGRSLVDEEGTCFELCERAFQNDQLDLSARTLHCLECDTFEVTPRCGPGIDVVPRGHPYRRLGSSILPSL